MLETSKNERLTHFCFVLFRFWFSKTPIIKTRGKEVSDRIHFYTKYLLKAVFSPSEFSKVSPRPIYVDMSALI